jgi:hypothetical protein
MSSCSSLSRLLAGAALAGSLSATALTIVASLPRQAGRADASAAAAGSAGSSPARVRRPRPAPAALTVAWVGDTVLGSRHGIPPAEGRGLLAEVRRALRTPDLTVGNLEGTLSIGGTAKCAPRTPNCFAFQAPPRHAHTLRWAGFDVVNLANNHSYDFGADGRRQTVRALIDAGVAHTGLPGQITVVRRRGLSVAVLGFAPYPWAASLTDLPAAARLVAAARRRADVVIVTMHAGAEGGDQTHTPVGPERHLGEPRGDSRAFAHAVVDAGADLVLGSGPHVLRGIERYRGRLIAYSLGNFVGYHTFSTQGAMALSGLLTVTLTRTGRPVRGRFTPLELRGPGRPVPDPSGRATRLVAQLSRQDFGAGAAAVAGDGRLRLP